MNCLTYLLDLWRKGERFQILYNSDHVIGYNETDFYDYGNYDYKNAPIFEPIEICHTNKTIEIIFKLNELDSKTLEEYYEVKNN